MSRKETTGRLQLKKLTNVDSTKTQGTAKRLGIFEEKKMESKHTKKHNNAS